MRGVVALDDDGWWRYVRFCLYLAETSLQKHQEQKDAQVIQQADVVDRALIYVGCE